MLSSPVPAVHPKDPVCSRREIKKLFADCGTTSGSAWYAREPVSGLLPSGCHGVFFLPKAWEDLSAFICFGCNMPQNQEEQKVYLEGYRFWDTESESLYNYVVTDVYCILPAERSATYVSVSNANDNGDYTRRMNIERDVRLRHAEQCNTYPDGTTVNPFLRRFGSPTRIGDLHTHPHMGTRPSGTDLAYIGSSRYIHIIVNPCAGEVSVNGFVGLDQSPAAVCFFEKQSMTASRVRSRQDIAADDSESDKPFDTPEAMLRTLFDKLLSLPRVRGKFRAGTSKDGSVWLRTSVRIAPREER